MLGNYPEESIQQNENLLAIERKYTKFILSQWLHTTTNSYCHNGYSQHILCRSGYSQQQIHTVTVVTHHNKFILSQWLQQILCHSGYTKQQIHAVTMVIMTNSLSQWLHTTTNSHCHNR